MTNKDTELKKILVTDTLFIFPEHEAVFRSAGYEIYRLPKSESTETELAEAIKGKYGYLLGGIELVTDNVINAADKLQAIVYAGSDAKAFIPGYELATQKGISIANAPGANRYAVAEYTITLMLMMLRRVLELGRTGEETFLTTDSMRDMHVGICGLGNIGQQVIDMLKGMGVGEISYYSRTRKSDMENKFGLNYLTLEKLFSDCDIISIHTPDDSGQFVTRDNLKRMKESALLINTNGSDNAIDTDALFDSLNDGKIRAAFDYTPTDERFSELPLSNWFCSNMSTAYNTHQACKKASDMATDTMINILTRGTDSHVLNF